MASEVVNENGRRRDEGFALILALLCLTLLTFLGLTLSLTTTSELQIATNYRYADQALRNAEAGLDVARLELQAVDWRAVLPPSRAAEDMDNDPSALPMPARVGADGLPSRNWEGRCVDEQDITKSGNVGYGIVFDIVTYANSFQGVNTYRNQSIAGSFTVWIRRPIAWDPAGGDPAGSGGMVDTPSDDQAILTIEGTAPYATISTVPSIRTQQLGNRAVRMIEARVNLNPPGCDDQDAAQTGQGSTGSGYAGACSELNSVGNLGSSGATLGADGFAAPGAPGVAQ